MMKTCEAQIFVVNLELSKMMEKRGEIRQRTLIKGIIISDKSQIYFFSIMKWPSAKKS